MNVLLVSPYHGGSHQAWAEGYSRYSSHRVQLLTLPARFWKWRMHGGAVTLARNFLDSAQDPDLILATDMLDVTTFLSLTRPATEHIPLVLYMHENQLTYPLPGEGKQGPMRRQRGERDLHYVFINYASMLAADRVLFNSAYHHESWFSALPRFLKHFPENNELETVDELRARSEVLAVGIDLQALKGALAGSDDAALPPQKQSGSTRSQSAAPDGDKVAPPTATTDHDTQASSQRAPLILWNQRWEYDKNPSAFFRALYHVQSEGIPFRLALCGQNYRRQPAEFEEARERLAQELVHVGYARQEQYRRLLWEASIVISTARHEFFGLSILEAIYCRTFPLLPRRLSYPELIPDTFHGHCLYEDHDDLLQRLQRALTRPEESARLAEQLAPAVEKYAWTKMAPRYDATLSGLIEENKP